MQPNNISSFISISSSVLQQKKLQGRRLSTPRAAPDSGVAVITANSQGVLARKEVELHRVFDFKVSQEGQEDPLGTGSTL